MLYAVLAPALAAVSKGLLGRVGRRGKEYCRPHPSGLEMKTQGVGPSLSPLREG